MNTIITTTLKEYPAINITELEKCLSLSRYGAITHKEMRSAYIHEGRSGDGSHGFQLSESLTKPTYISGIYTTSPAIGFGVKFMLQVLEECINAFEAEALTLQQDPVPEN